MRLLVTIALVSAVYSNPLPDPVSEGSYYPPNYGGTSPVRPVAGGVLVGAGGPAGKFVGGRGLIGVGGPAGKFVGGRGLVGVGGPDGKFVGGRGLVGVGGPAGKFVEGRGLVGVGGPVGRFSKGRGVVGVGGPIEGFVGGRRDFGTGAGNNVISIGGAGGSSCDPNELLDSFGNCVEAPVVTNTFVFRPPPGLQPILPPLPDIPPRRRIINYNYVNIPDPIPALEPVVILPDVVENKVVVVGKNVNAGRPIIQVPQEGDVQPEVIYVSAGEGDNPVLPGGLTANEVLNADGKFGRVFGLDNDSNLPFPRGQDFHSSEQFGQSERYYDPDY